MKSNESRAWMLGNNMIPLLQQGQLGGKLWAEEAPSGIVHQLFISFVVLIGGQKKSLWVACMDGHWNAQFATLLPNGIETRIVHGEQFAGLVLDAEAQVFEHFQPARATAHGIVQLLDHFLTEIGIIHFAPVELCEDQKPIGILDRKSVV